MIFSPRLRALARTLLLLTVLAAGASVGCTSTTRATAPDVAAREPAPKPAFWVSSPTDLGRRLQTVAPSSGARTPTAEIVVHPGQARQAWWGTGAALTDASVQLLRDRGGVLRTLFDPKAATGARIHRNPDGTVGVFGHNRSDVEQTVRLGVGRSARTYPVRPGELFSYRAPLPR